MKYNVINGNGKIINTIVYNPDEIEAGLQGYSEKLESYKSQKRKHDSRVGNYYKKYDIIAAKYLKEKKSCQENGIETTPELRKLKRELNKIPRPPAPPLKPKKPAGHYVPPKGCRLEKAE